MGQCKSLGPSQQAFSVRSNVSLPDPHDLPSSALASFSSSSSSSNAVRAEYWSTGVMEYCARSELHPASAELAAFYRPYGVRFRITRGCQRPKQFGCTIFYLQRINLG